MPIDKFIEGFDFAAEGFDPDEFKKAALAEYNKDHSIWQAKVTDQDSKIKDKESEIGKLKVTNYDLLNMVPKDAEEAKTPADKEADHDPDLNPSWDDLIEKKEN